MEVKEIAFNPTFISRMIPKIDWTVLRAAAETVSTHTHLYSHLLSLSHTHTHHVVCWPQLGHGQGLPESLPEDYESQEDFLKQAHHVLMEVCVCVCVCMHSLPLSLYIRLRWWKAIWSVQNRGESFQSLKEFLTCYSERMKCSSLHTNFTLVLLILYVLCTFINSYNCNETIYVICSREL